MVTQPQDQLRMYTVRPGEMGEWVAEWQQRIVPLRKRFGFEILGAWTIESENKFVWIIRYPDAARWKEADAGYYASPERKAIQPDPARHLARTETWLMQPIVNSPAVS